MSNPQSDQIAIQKSAPVWKRADVNFKDLIFASGRGAISGAFGNWEEVAKSGVDALEALGIGQ